ncbi:MAG: DUF4861 domain-containing protein [Dysgonomonas sp.]
MKQILRLILILPCLISCSTSVDTKNIILANNSDRERVDEVFIINRNQLKSANKTLLPAIKNSTGEWIPSQIDDLDKDGEWDELAFVYSFQPNEQVTLSIEWIPAESYPVFTPRTNARYGKMLSPGNIVILKTDLHGKDNLARGAGYPYQTDGPAWENDKMGFRHYFDGRNVRDIFGKRTDKMVMDTVGIRSDGIVGDTYHELRWWGRDIMSGGNSIGLGGIALQTPDSLIRLGVTIDKTTDNIDSTRYTLVTNGPVRSIFKLDFYGWDIKGEKIDVDEKITIWAGKFGYENIIKTSTLPQGTNLVTGIVNSFNDKPYEQAEIGDYKLMATHDKQTYDKIWYMGMGLLIPRNNFVETFEVSKSGSGITTTWCAKLKPNENEEYHFNCYAAWELTDERFTDREYFLKMMRTYTDNLNNKIVPVLK